METNQKAPINSFIHDFEQFTTGKNFWQASLIKQVEGLTVEQALYVPAPGRHCIWELVRHIAYWKLWAFTYVNTGEKLNAKEHNWAPLPEVQDENSWDKDVEYLRSMNDKCLEAAKSLGDTIFTSPEEKVVFFRQVLLHDCYHTGQIGLLRALQDIKPVE